MKQVALIYMPWGNIEEPSLAIGLLKSVLIEENIPADALYFNVRLAKYIGRDSYKQASFLYHYFSEWIFAQCLFGEKGTGELTTGYDDLLKVVFEYYPKSAMEFRKAKKLILSLINDIMPRYVEDCLDTIAAGGYKVVGFRCTLGSQLSSLFMSKKIKERFPDIKVIFGGPNVCSPQGAEILRSFEWVDYVIDGEGELALPALVKNIIQGRLYEKIPGVLLRDENNCVQPKEPQAIVSLDTLPMPDYTEYFEEIENAGLTNMLSDVRIDFEGSRGCWWGDKVQCSFCANPHGTAKYRIKSPEKVLNELIEFTTRHNIKKYSAMDNVLNYDFFNNLLPEMLEKKMELDVLYEVKANLSRQQLDMLHKSGVRYVQAGIENLNTELLKLLRKGVSALTNIQFLKLCTEYGIGVAWNILHRIPGEKKEYYDQIIRLVPSVCHLTPPNGAVVVALIRFSPYFYDPGKFGVKDIRPVILYDFLYPKGKVNFNDIAYTFSYTYENCDEVLKSYSNELSSVLFMWKKAFYEKKFFLEYRIKGEAVEIRDNRPDSFGVQISEQQPGELKTYTLEGAEKHVFLLCDEIHSFDEIYTDIIQNTKFDIDRNQLGEILDKLINYRILLAETGKYLTLAINRGGEA